MASSRNIAVGFDEDAAAAATVVTKLSNNVAYDYAMMVMDTTRAEGIHIILYNEKKRDLI